jgi:hypothetical protein
MEEPEELFTKLPELLEAIAARLERIDKSQDAIEAKLSIIMENIDEDF